MFSSFSFFTKSLVSTPTNIQLLTLFLDFCEHFQFITETLMEKSERQILYEKTEKNVLTTYIALLICCRNSKFGM